MRILIAPERFYPTMKAQATAEAMARGLRQVSPHFELVLCPLASGGGGTADIAVRLGGGRIHREIIPVPNRRPREVKWAMMPDGTAIFDAIDAMGKPDGPSQLNKTYTNSVALGDMLQRLIAKQPHRIVVALGDVLAADGGMGLLESFGIYGLDQDDRHLTPGTRQLLTLHRIDFSTLSPPTIPVLALTDISVSWNQRVQEEDFRLNLIHGGLDQASCRFVNLLGEHVRVPLGDLAGTGVGGGLGMALAFLGAQFMSGAEYLAEMGHLGEKALNVDWMLTGSAELTAHSREQSVGVAALKARDAGVPAVALTMALGHGHSELYDAGLIGMYGVLDRPRQERDTQRALPALIEKAAFRVGYWMQALSDL